jgi:hypothetical protein
MPRFAEKTDVPVERSRAEIEQILTRYGATGFGYAWDGNRTMIAFKVAGRQVRFVLPLPDPSEFRLKKQVSANQYRRHETNLPATPAEAKQAYEQAIRQRWRALALVIKAKLEAVEAGIVSFEDEFLAHTLLPDGQSIGQWLKPQIEQVVLTGRMPSLLPMLEEGAA